MNVSVVIPAFNASKYLAQTLDSIRAQTIQPREVIIIDDGSTDDTARLVRGYIYEHNYMIKLYPNPRNMGIGATRQKGANLAEGEYVAFLSSDDCYASTFLEKSQPYLSPNTATYTKYFFCNKKLEPQTIFQAPPYTKQSVIDWALRKNMYVNFSSVILPKKIFEKAKFEAGLRHSEDLIFLLDTVIAGLNCI